MFCLISNTNTLISDLLSTFSITIVTSCPQNYVQTITQENILLLVNRSNVTSKGLSILLLEEEGREISKQEKTGIKKFPEGLEGGTIILFIIWLCLTRTGNYRIHEFDWLKSILTTV